MTWRKVRVKVRNPFTGLIEWQWQTYLVTNPDERTDDTEYEGAT